MPFAVSERLSGMIHAVLERQQLAQERALARARGILDESTPITDTDRRRYRDGEAQRLFCQLFPEQGIPVFGGSGQIEFVPLSEESIRQYRERVKEIDGLTPEQVDEKIKGRARTLIEQAEARR